MQDYAEVSCSFSGRPGFPYLRPRVIRYFDLTSDFSFHIPKWIQFEVQMGPTHLEVFGTIKTQRSQTTTARKIVHPHKPWDLLFSFLDPGGGRGGFK